MLLLQERALFRDALLEIELHDDLRYRLCYAEEVEFSNGRMRIGAKLYPYAFRSVEQLRYDFEREVLAAGGRLA